MSVIGPFGFNGGLNTSTSVFDQPKNTLSTLQDTRHLYGSLVERFGISTLVASIKGSGSKAVQGIIPNFLSPTTYPFLVIQDGKIYGISSSGAVTDITGTSSLNAGTENQINNASILNGVMIISDAQGSSGSLVRWSGSGNCSNLGTGPDGVSVRTVNNFMFTFPSGSSTLYWSAVADATTWPAGSNLPFRQSDGDVIKAIHYIGTDLYIFKAYSIGRLSTQTQFIDGTVALGPLVEVSVGLGCAGYGAVDKLPDGRLVFLGSDSHAYLFDGSTPQDISDQPYPGPNAQALFDACSPSTFGNYTRVTTYLPRNEVWFSMSTNPSSTGNPMDRVIAWNYKDNTWTQFTFSSVSSGSRPGGIAWVPTLNGATNGLTNGGAYNSEGNLVTAFRDVVAIQDVTNSTTGPVSPQWNTSLPLAGEGRTFIPRSLLLFHKGTSASGAFSVSYGFDGGSIGNSKSITPTTSYTRTVISLVAPSTGQSSSGPSSLQIQVSDSTGGGTLFDPFYLSDEVMV